MSERAPAEGGDIVERQSYVRLTWRRLVWMAGALMLLGTGTAHAQQDPPPPDSLRPFRLGDIVVAAARDLATSSYTADQIELSAINGRDAAAVAEIARLIPAAHVQTNSRGETLVYLRSAGERQLGLFYDGALLNVPWDNRVDLSLIPSGAIGGMSVAKGVPPVEFGANVLGGAVNLISRMETTEGPFTEFTTRFGTEGRREGAFGHQARVGRLSFGTTVAYSETDGIPLPSGADLPFSQSGDGTRTNTDARIANLVTRVEYDPGNDTRIGLSFLHLDARKGVAPEGHLDPTLSRVRFWRYPDWRNTIGILSGEGYFGYDTHWRGALWVNAFAQDIESFRSVAYEALDGRQEDTDLTVGSRFVIRQPIGLGSLKFALNALTSTHRQRDIAFDVSGVADSAPRLRFQQHVLSVGSEYTHEVSPVVQLSVGASLDAMFMPQTGDKPERDAFTDYSITTGLTYDGGAWFVRSAVGRKTRFPTMRELFGESLNRFLVNPDLRPESSILSEIGLGIRGARFSGEVIPFATFTSNTIDQRSVLLDGETRPRRQRVNLRGSRVLGVEMTGSVEVTTFLEVQGHLTVMDIARRRETADEPERISEKPQVLSRVAAAVESGRGTSLLVETVYTGRAYSPDEDNVFVPLNTSLVVNLRVGHTVILPSGLQVELFARTDNVTDEVVIPQLGLPGPGRSVSGGAKFTL